jgi:hypothetical protein
MLGHSVTKCGQLQIHSVYGIDKKDRLTLSIAVATVMIVSISANSAVAGGPRMIGTKDSKIYQEHQNVGSTDLMMVKLTHSVSQEMMNV